MQWIDGNKLYHSKFRMYVFLLSKFSQVLILEIH